MPSPSIYLKPTNDLREVAKELRTVADGKALRKELTGGIRDVLRPVLNQARAAYRGLPGRSRHARGRGELTTLLSKATRMEVRTSGKLAGVRLRVDGRKMPSGMRAIPAYVEREKARWRHPVFANRDLWVESQPFPTFYRTVEPHRDDVGRSIDRVLADVKAKIERQR